MKSAFGKTCQEQRIELCHDSSNCVSCKRTTYFYTVFQPNLKTAISKLRRSVTDLSENVGVCGLITFLRACCQYYDRVSDDQKSGPLTDKPNSKLPDADHIDPELLNLILFANLDSTKVDTSFLSSLFALKHKHKNKAEKPHKQPFKKNELIDIRKPRSSKKIVKTKLKKEVSDKIPTKGSLKRKRWLQKKLSNEEEENYVDDIFEERPFYYITDLDENSSSDYSGVSTPTWSYALSPHRTSSPTPEHVTDCYDITELRIERKNAEEYQHRRKKRMESKKDKNNCAESDRSSQSVSQSEADKACQPSCSYTIPNPVREEEDYDSDEIPDDYYPNSEDEDKSNRNIS